MDEDTNRLNGQLRLIREDTSILNSNKKHIVRFLKIKEAESTVPGRRLFLAQKLKVIGQFIDKPFKKAKKDDIADIINKAMNGTRIVNGETIKRYSESSIEQFKTVIIEFYYFLYNRTKHDSRPDCVKWIVKKTVRNKLRDKDLLTDEEIAKIIRATSDTQIKAILATISDIGPRIGELKKVKFKDIEILDNKIKLYLVGKGGIQRTVSVVRNYNILKAWIDNHPYRTPESYLFSSTRNKKMDRPFSTQYLNRKWKDLAKKAGITKRIYNHLFRHRKLTDWYSKNPVIAKKLSGHLPNSRMEEIYVHLSDTDCDEFQDEECGLIPEKKKEKPVCKRCNTPLSLVDRRCTNCGLFRDEIAAEEWEKEELTLSEKNLDKIAALLVPRINDILAKSKENLR